ncbi:hypothetical protein [Actinophytocola gossypii]|uniref:Lipoprotein n=1 Tax=Actinophytocola gossypii TaxID=2812003 RepID=A0ABT2JH74_9PSEU|nr:hypothetical protein [Actinophytocola gossypii]MCT2586629.1 hypothetical protein [Actinophytocola gossypii]
MRTITYRVGTMLAGAAAVLALAGCGDDDPPAPPDLPDMEMPTLRQTEPLGGDGADGPPEPPDPDDGPTLNQTRPLDGP